MRSEKSRKDRSARTAKPPSSLAPTVFVRGGLLEELSQEAGAFSKELVKRARMLGAHKVHTDIKSVAHLRSYMTFHVWCVWDFMSLAKSLQMGVGCFQIPWMPPSNLEAVSIIDRIVDSEEADIGPNGEVQSHFEIYLDAMREARADTSVIERFVTIMSRRDTDVASAMSAAGAEQSSVDFVESTMRFCRGPLHVRAAAFCLGREEVIPNVLSGLLQRLPHCNTDLTKLSWYVHRHISLDTATHGPLSAQLFRSLVGTSEVRRKEALEAGLAAIRAREVYFDHVRHRLKEIPA